MSYNTPPSLLAYHPLSPAMMKVANACNHASKQKFGDIISPSLPPLAAASSNGFDDNNNINGINLSLLEAVEKSHSSIEVLDLKALKKLVLAFERCLKDNIEARLKYPNLPNRFADPEIELHEELQKLKVLAGALELYPGLVNLNVVPSIVDLLNHDNTDIVVDIVQLLQDLTDEDVIEDNDELVRVLVDILVENSVLELLVQNLHRLSDFDPNKMVAVYNTLATIVFFGRLGGVL